MDPFHFAQFLLGVGEQVDSLAAYGVGKQDLGGEAGNRYGSVCQDLRALQKGRLDGHERRRLTKAGK